MKLVTDYTYPNPSLVFTLPSGSVFPVGTTLVTVHVTATDASGNVAVETFNVTVKDTGSPLLIAQDVTVEIGPDGTACHNPFPTGAIVVDRSDNCGLTSYLNKTGPHYRSSTVGTREEAVIVSQSTEPIEEHLGRSLEAQSILNVGRMRAGYGDFSLQEKQILTMVGQLPLRYSTRMNINRLMRAVKNEQLLPSAESDLENEVNPEKIVTPHVEERMYQGKKYIFTTIHPSWSGLTDYGHFLIQFRPEKWDQVGWGTKGSGFRAIVTAIVNKTGRPVTEIEQEVSDANRNGTVSDEYIEWGSSLFSEWIVTPNHFRDSIALRLIKRLRAINEKMASGGTLSDEEAKALELAEYPGRFDADSLREVINSLWEGYLEGHIFQTASLSTIESIGVPPADSVEYHSGHTFELLTAHLDRLGVRWYIVEE